MPRSRKTTISLAEVAEIAGVSISTASKVANGGANVAEATREKVARVLAEHRYETPSQRHRRWPTVGLLIRGMAMPNVHVIAQGAIDAAQNKEIAVQMIHLDPQAERQGANAKWLERLARTGVEGVVAINSTLTEEVTQRLASFDVSLITVNPFDRPDGSGYSVGCTDWAGGLEVTEHLLELGHTQIVMLGGDTDTLCSRARTAGYSSAMTSAGLEPRVIPGQFTHESGLVTATEILTGSAPPTAIVSASDFQATGVLEAARLAGLRVPSDVSVTGFDDTLLASVSSPPLTTVRQPFEAMGRVALELVAELVLGNNPSTHYVELSTSLVTRESTARPA